MRSIILISVTLFMLVTTGLTIDTVRYHETPQNGLDPLAPITIKLALN